MTMAVLRLLVLALLLELRLGLLFPVSALLLAE
jgi:hypothetical protein